MFLFWWQGLASSGQWLGSDFSSDVNYYYCHVGVVISLLLPVRASQHRTFPLFCCCYLFIYFTLKYCIGFAIHWHEFTMGVHVFPTLPSTPTSLPIPSLWVIPVHQPLALVSCIELGLAIRFTYDILQVLMLFSHIIPPLPSPRVQKTALYICVSFFCLAYSVIITIFLNSIYMHWYTVLVFFFMAYFTLYNGLHFHPSH